MEKICSTCGQLKSINEFHRDVSKPDGHRNNCKLCASTTKDYRKNIEHIREKMCNVCKTVKPLELFTKDDRTPLGYGKKCLACASEKLCRGCFQKKHVDEFPKKIRESADGYRSKCKACENAMKRERYKEESRKNRILAQNAGYRFKKGTREGTRERMLLKKYDMTIENYQVLLDAQEGRCRICKCLAGERGRTHLAVDHHHETGDVRGLLCDPCNRGLGMFKDNPEFLENAIQYLMAARFG